MAKQPPQPEAAKPRKASPKLLAQVTLVNPEYANEPEDGPVAAQGIDSTGVAVSEGALGRSADIPAEAMGLTESTRVPLLDLVEPSLQDENRPTAVRVADINDSNLAETLANAGASNLVPLAPLGAIQWASIAGASVLGVAAGASSGGAGSSGSASGNSGGNTAGSGSSVAGAGGGGRSAPGQALGASDNYVNAREAADSAVIGGKTAVPGAQISILLKQVQPDGVTVIRDLAIENVATNADGSWQLPDNTVAGLTDGNYRLTVIAIDAQGNRSESIQSFIVDKAPPTAPIVVALNSSINSSLSSSVTDTTPTLFGTATPGDKIHVLSPTGETIETTAAPDGSWSITPTIELAAGGPRSFVVTAFDAAGNSSTPTFVPVSITVPPSFTAALASGSDSASAGDSITNITRPTISGIAKPGANIAVATSSGEIIDTVAAADGSWSVTLNTALAEGGPQKISVRSLDSNGTSTSISLPIIIDTTAPQRVAASLASSSDSGLPGDFITNDTTPTLFGIGADPGDYIRVTSPTGEVMQSVVNLDGRWSVTPATVLDSSGDQVFRINVSDIAGNTGPATSLLVHVDSIAPAAPQACLDLAYANGSTTAGHTRTPLPTISGHDAEPGSLITVTSPTGEVLTVTPFADGTWCVTSTVALAAGGPQVFVVTATDPAGNVSPPTAVEVTVDVSMHWQAAPLLDFSVVNDSLILSSAAVSTNPPSIETSVGQLGTGSTGLSGSSESPVSPPLTGASISTLLAPLDGTLPII